MRWKKVTPESVILTRPLSTSGESSTRKPLGPSTWFLIMSSYFLRIKTQESPGISPHQRHKATRTKWDFPPSVAPPNNNSRAGVKKALICLGQSSNFSCIWLYFFAKDKSYRIAVGSGVFYFLFILPECAITI